MNKDLTVGNPQKVLWKFCLPLFGSIIFQQIYNIADSLIAGKFIGENAFKNTALSSVKISSDCVYSQESFPDGCKIEFY